MLTATAVGALPAQRTEASICANEATRRAVTQRNLSEAEAFFIARIALSEW